MKIPLVEQLESVDSRMIEDSPSYVMKLIDEAVDVLRSTEAVERDAARYRWLQREIDLRGLPDMPEEVRSAIYNCDGNALDLAIDAAMRPADILDESKK